MTDNDLDLGERLRQLPYLVEMYRDAGETDELVLATAREIEGGMAWLGMDDAIVQLASEVEALERGRIRTLAVTMSDIVAQVEVEDDALVLWRCPECHAQVLCIWEGAEMDKLRLQQFCPHDFEQPEFILISKDELGAQKSELMLRLADAYSQTMKAIARSGAYGEDELPDWVNSFLNALELSLKGDPGCIEPEEFQQQRRRDLQEHGPRLQWGDSMIVEGDDG